MEFLSPDFIERVACTLTSSSAAFAEIYGDFDAVHRVNLSLCCHRDKRVHYNMRDSTHCALTVEELAAVWKPHSWALESLRVENCHKYRKIECVLLTDDDEATLKGLIANCVWRPRRIFLSFLSSLSEAPIFAIVKSCPAVEEIYFSGNRSDLLPLFSHWFQHGVQPYLQYGKKKLVAID